MTDMVNRPPHYTDHPSGVECIEIAEHFSFNLGNVLKYLWRAGRKGDRIEDLRKAQWYLEREIARLRKIEAGDSTAARAARKSAKKIMAEVSQDDGASRSEIAVKLAAEVAQEATEDSADTSPPPTAEPEQPPQTPDTAAPDAAETAAEASPLSLGGDAAAPAPDEPTASGATPSPVAEQVVPPTPAAVVVGPGHRPVGDPAPGAVTKLDLAIYVAGLPKDPFWTADRDAELVRILCRGEGVHAAARALKCNDIAARERWNLLVRPIRQARDGTISIAGQAALIAVLNKRAGWS